MTSPQSPNVPEVIQVLDAFRAQLLNADARAARRLISAYGPIWTRLSQDVDSLLLQINEQQLTMNQTLKLQRFQALQRQIEVELSTFASAADGTITQGQRDVLRLSQARARAVISASLPPGINLDLLGQIGVEWNALPSSAVEAFVGFSGDGAPLINLLTPLGPEVVEGVTAEIADSIARGRSPRQAARLIRNRVGMGLTRSLRIARTEQLRAYREATRMEYQLNPGIVKGYQRHASKSPRTCQACLALDGTFYDLDTPLNEHVSGRCALVPVTLSYKDLGLDVPEPDMTRELGPEWFDKQPVTTQRAMMGKARHKAWKSGQFQFTDQAKLVPSSTWGEQAVVKPLKELIQ